MEKRMYLWCVFACLLCACAEEQSITFLNFALHETGPITLHIGYVQKTAEPPLVIQRTVMGKPAFTVETAEFICNSVQALLPNKECNAPKTLAEMFPLASLASNGYYTSDAIYGLADQMPGNPTDVRIVVLDGRIDPKEVPWCLTPTACVVGFTTSSRYGQRVIAVFWPEIVDKFAFLSDSEARSLSMQFTYATTVVHELGHLTGLVDGGVSMVVPHEEASGTPNHCNNPRCTMSTYGSNRSVTQWEADRTSLGPAADAAYDDKCLHDVHHALTY